MAFARIIIWLGNTFIFCALMAILSALAAVFLVEYSLATKFAALGASIGGLGVILLLSSYKTDVQDSNSDSLLFLILFWAFVPYICAVPFMFEGGGIKPLQAYFESVSAITTTGASTLDADSLSRSLLLWRSVLQWFGGVFAATFAVVILAALNMTGTGVHRSILFTLERGNLLPRLMNVGRIIGLIYLSLSVFCFLGLAISGTPIFESICLALTSVSTGGLTPRSGVLANYVHPFGGMIMGITCLLGAASIAILWDAFRLRSWIAYRRLVTNVEQRALLVMCAILILLGLIVVGPGHLMTIILESMFFVSSAGFDYHVIGIDMIAPTPLIVIALIGGAALSTAGGLKIIRFLLLFRHFATDIGRLTHPSRVIPVKFRGRLIPDRAFLSIWMYFFGYTILLGLVILAFGLSGMDFELATIAGAAGLSNMGPLLTITSLEASYSDFTDTQLTLFSFIMLIGRVEVLALMAVMFPSAWRQ